MATTTRGISYPLTVSLGGLRISEDVQLIREQIFSYLETMRRERVMQPRYGRADEIFDPIVQGVTANAIQDGLTREIPVAKFEVGSLTDPNGILVLEVGWSVDGIPQAPIGFTLD